MTTNRTVTIHVDAARLAEAAADGIIACARDTLARQPHFTLVLAGGSTPEKTYRLLADASRAQALDWSRTFVFMGDERFVPYDDPRSNYGMARRTLLDHVPLPADHLFPMPTSGPSASECAQQYAATLAQWFHLSSQTTPPRFDLVLLGLGDDGHTASLFPGSPALDVTDAWVVASPPGVLPPPVERITLTYPVLNAARNVWFLVSGASKALAVRDVLQDGAQRQIRPAAGVVPADGALIWMLDEAAAQQLPALPTH